MQHLHASAPTCSDKIIDTDNWEPPPTYFVFPNVDANFAKPSAPPTPTHMATDADALLATDLQRSFEQELEQLTLDEAIAYSLTLKDAREMNNHGNDADADGYVSVDHTEGKPPPNCVCCVLPLHQGASRRVLPCGHLYCVACIKTRCLMGVRDRSLVPAHCCKKEFPTEYVREVLKQEEWRAYERFVDEKTWVKTGLELASDKEYADAIKKCGWKQCPECGIGVEKIDGCDAVKCLRGHWFCYHCGRAPCTCGKTRLETYGFRG